MSDNNANATNHKKQSKYYILAIICCAVMVGSIFIASILNISEGYIAILNNIILPFSFNFIVFIMYKYIKIDIEHNKNIKNKRKSIRAMFVFFLICFIGYTVISYVGGFYKRAYHGVFENSQTIVTNDYEVTTYYHKGRYYRIRFYDVQNPDKCFEEYDDVCAIYKTLDINKTTYKKLKDLEPETNPLRITFKDKAEVVMNIELSQNGLSYK